MSFLDTLKNFFRRFLPVSRDYADQKIKMLEKSLRGEMQAQYEELQKEIKAGFASQKKYISQEWKRRDDWEKRRTENEKLAQGRPIWVIKCPAPNNARKVTWGDYHYAVALKKYLERLDRYVLVDTYEDWDCDSGADVVVVLRGKRFYRPDRRDSKCLYILWNISHPDMLSPEECQLYDVVCVASRFYAEKLKESVTVPVLPLLQCTDTELFCPGEGKREDLKDQYIFVGNTREVARKCVMWAVDKKLPLRIWGLGWEKILKDHEAYMEASSIENSALPDVYRSAKATLNDHWKDMLDNQFISNRIFDALACGLPVISDCCDELKEIFPDAVLYYSSREEFAACISKLENDYDRIKRNVEAQRQLICEQYSFAARASELTEIAESYRPESRT